MEEGTPRVEIHLIVVNCKIQYTYLLRNLQQSPVSSPVHTNVSTLFPKNGEVGLDPELHLSFYCCVLPNVCNTDRVPTVVPLRTLQFTVSLLT